MDNLIKIGTYLTKPTIETIAKIAKKLKKPRGMVQRELIEHALESQKYKEILGGK